MQMPPSTAHALKYSAPRIFLISGLGTALEFYDFIIYGYAAALAFPKVFFPNLDHMMATLVAFMAFGTGFFARPLGGIVFGHWGDRFGRRRVLVATLLTMGSSTFAIGCVPSYAAVGPIAPVVLVILRLIQGFAAGGEWGGAALFGIESAPAGQRGLWGSFTSMGIGIGFFLGSAVFATTNFFASGNVSNFAWRVPFWLGGVLVVIGVLARSRQVRGAEEPRDAPRKLPLVEATSLYPRQMLLSIGVAFGYVTIAYLATTFFLSYVTQVGYSDSQALLLDLTQSSTIIFSAPFFGHMSDRFGRRRIMMLGAAALAAAFFAFFPLVNMLNMAVATATYALIGLLIGATQGPIPALLAEQFPRSLRYSGISSTYQIGAALGGGTASSVATAILIVSNKNPQAVAVYGGAALLLVAVCSYFLKETSHLSLEEIDRVVHAC